MRFKGPNKAVPEFSADLLLRSATLSVRDIYCRGTCREHGPEESATATELVFPYRGAYVRHLGQDQAVAEANQVLFFNATEEYRMSHPVAGGDASLSLAVDPSLLLELAPIEHLHDKPGPAFHRQQLRIDARAQALVA